MTRSIWISVTIPVALLAAVIGIIILLGEQSPSGVRPSDQALADIPAEYLDLYVEAGERFETDWWVLAGIGKVESDHGRLRAPGVTRGVNSYGCCAGPMQFAVSHAAGCRVCVGDTWGAYGRDENGDGVASVYDPADAIAAAARYTRANGAPGDWKRALWRYNASEAYRVEVMQWATTYRGAAASAGAQPLGSPTSGLAWPARGPVVSPFGPRWGRMHEGIDIAIPSGTPLRASAAGTVAYAGVLGGYGNVVDLAHPAGLSTRYAHQTTLLVRAGERVAQGEVIGLSGCTGHCFGPHVHFETRRQGVAQDPQPLLPAAP